MKSAKKALVAMVAAMLAFAAQAVTYNTATYDGKTWSYYVNDAGQAVIQAGEGSAIPKTTSGTVNIPGKLGGYTVAGIGDYAFYQCTAMEFVRFPASVTSIGNYAFYQCTSLRLLEDIPDNLVSIGFKAFEACSLLWRVRIPASVRSLGSRAFYGCSGMGFLDIEEGLAAIPDAAFANCAYLDDVTIPDSVTTVGANAFAGCGDLAEVSMPASLKAVLPANAFSGCPPDIEFVYRRADTVDGHLWSYVVVDGKAVIYKGTYTPVVPKSTEGTVAIPSELGGMPVAGIGDYAFYECADLEGVTIPDGVTSIGDSAFCDCHNLERVSFPAGLKSIGGEAFYGCDALESVTMPDGVTSVGVHAFAECASLKRAYVPGTVTDFGRGVFDECRVLERVTFGKGLREIPDETFSSCEAMEEFIVPDGVTRIGDYAFWGCSDLESLAIPKSVASIGTDAFKLAGDLETVYVARGDAKRVKGLVEGSGRSTAGIAFVEAAYVTFDANGGSCATPCVVRATGAAVGPLPHAARDGYALAGWFTAAEGGTQVTAETVVTEDTTFYAHWTQPSGGDACYARLERADIWEPYVAQKAQTLRGAMYEGCELVASVELKFSKPNAKKGTCKVSGSITTLEGKKYTVKPLAVALNTAQNLASSAALQVKGLGTLWLAFGGNRFAGDLGEYHLQSANVGGNWTKSAATAKVAISDVSAFSGMVLADLLPLSEAVVGSNGKWKFAKAASVKWAKPKAGVAPVLFDAASGKGLVVDTTNDRTNLSGLKLTYTPKKGTFKGSFKVYALQGAGSATKLKKYTVNVNGVVIDGVGHGKATMKKPSFSCPVTVE